MKWAIMSYAARQLNTPRLVVHWLPQDLRAHKKFGARLREREGAI